MFVPKSLTYASPLTIAILVLGFSLYSRAQGEVANDPAATRSLGVGERAPSFEVERANGVVFKFNPTRLSRPQVVIFYRGGWCPYCNMQLADLHEVEPKLHESGFDVLFLSTDKPDLLYTSTKDKHLPYTLLSDRQLKAAEAFNIAYHLDADSYAKQLAYGVNLEETTGTTLHELPVPSVFIIDTSGVIRFVYSNPDFKIRLSADALWAAATPLAPKKNKASSEKPAVRHTS